MPSLLSKLFGLRMTTRPQQRETDYTAGIQPHAQAGKSNMPLMSAARYFRYGTFPDLSVDDLPDPVYRPINKYAIWVAPEVSFADMLNAYTLDSEIKFGIDFVTSVAVGAGFHFAAPSSRIVSYFEDFAEDINLDFIVQTAAYETLAYGNSVWRYGEYTDRANKFDQLVQMPLTALKRIWWNGWTQDSTIGFYEFRGYAVRRYLPSELIHFRYRIVNGSPYGLGLLAPLVQKVDYRLNWNGLDSTYTRMSLMDIKRSIEDTAHKIIKRYIPRNVYKTPSASPQQASALASSINQLLDEQDFVLPDGQADVLQLGNQTKAIDLEAFTSLYTNAVIKAIGTPVSRLFEKGALTEASAQSAKEAALMNLVGFQRIFRRQIERFILKSWYDQNPTTDANGVVIPWKLADLQLVWGQPEKMEIDGQGFARLVTAKPEAFSVRDIRKILAENGLPIDPEEQPSQTEQEQAVKNKLNNAFLGMAMGDNSGG